MFSMLAIIRGLRRAANKQCSLPVYRLDLWLEIMSLPMKGVRVFSLPLSPFSFRRTKEPSTVFLLRCSRAGPFKIPRYPSTQFSGFEGGKSCTRVRLGSISPNYVVQQPASQNVFHEKPVFICFPENVPLHWSTSLGCFSWASGLHGLRAKFVHE